MAVSETKREEDHEEDYVYVRHTPVSLNLRKDPQTNSAVFSDSSKSRCAPHPTLGQHWLLKQFCLNHPVEHIQKPKLPKLHVRVETSTSYFIIHNQFVK